MKLNILFFSLVIIISSSISSKAIPLFDFNAATQTGAFILDPFLEPEDQIIEKQRSRGTFSSVSASAERGLNGAEAEIDLEKGELKAKAIGVGSTNSAGIAEGWEFVTFDLSNISSATTTIDYSYRITGGLNNHHQYSAAIATGHVSIYDVTGTPQGDIFSLFEGTQFVTGGSLIDFAAKGAMVHGSEFSGIDADFPIISFEDEGTAFFDQDFRVNSSFEVSEDRVYPDISRPNWVPLF